MIGRISATSASSLGLTEPHPQQPRVSVMHRNSESPTDAAKQEKETPQLLSGGHWVLRISPNSLLAMGSCALHLY